MSTFKMSRIFSAEDILGQTLDEMKERNQYRGDTYCHFATVINLKGFVPHY